MAERRVLLRVVGSALLVVDAAKSHPLTDTAAKVCVERRVQKRLVEHDTDRFVRKARAWPLLLTIGHIASSRRSVQRRWSTLVVCAFVRLDDDNDDNCNDQKQ